MRLVFLLVSDLRFPETFLTYLLHLHNSKNLQCCYAAKTYEICLIFGRFLGWLPSGWAAFLRPLAICAKTAMSDPT